MRKTNIAFVQKIKHKKTSVLLQLFSKNHYTYIKTKLTNRQNDAMSINDIGF